MKFDTIFKLTTLVRLGPDEILFKNILSSVGRGITTDEHYNILTKNMDVIPNNKAIGLFRTRKEVNDFNIHKFNESTLPKFFINGIHHNTAFTDQDERLFEGLLNRLNLYVCQRIMLCVNISVVSDLAN